MHFVLNASVPHPYNGTIETMQSVSILSRVRLWLLAALVLGAPLSFAPSIALPLVNFPSFRIGLYQLVALSFVFLCAIPTIKSLPSLFVSNRIAFVGICCLAAVSLGGLLWSVDRPRTMLLVASVGLLLALVVCVWWYVKTLDTAIPQVFISVFLWASIVYALLALVQLAYGTIYDAGGLLCKGCKADVFGFPRINATAAEPLFYASALLPFALGSFWLTLKRVPLSSFALFASSLTIGLTFARGAFVAVAIGIIALVAMMIQKITWRAIAKTLLITLAGFVVAFALLVTSASINYHGTPNVTYNTIRSSLEHLSLGLIALPQIQQPPQVQSTTSSPANNSSNDFVSPGLIESSTNERTGSAALAFRALTNSPRTTLLGTGLGGLGPYVVSAIDRTAPYTLTVYIFYVLLLAEVGIVGFAGFLLLLFGVLRSLLSKYRSSLAPVLLALFGAFLVHYFFFGSYINVVYIWIWLGIMLGVTPTLELPGIIKAMPTSKNTSTHEE